MSAPDDVLPGLVDQPVPPALPEATEEQIAELLTRLKLRRAALVDSYVAGLGRDEMVVPAILEPLATIQAAIEAVEAASAEDRS